MDNNIFNFLTRQLKETIGKLGVLGTISYVAAVIIFFALFKVDFSREGFKAGILILVGVSLLIYSGVLYFLRVKEETVKIREALGVLREVYNRMAEQIASADKDKTVSITMTIDNLSDKISEVIKKTTSDD